MSTTATAPRVNTATQELKRVQLRRNRRWATGLLVAVTAVFAATIAAGAEGWVAYVQAAAEASMVGALADWFAVVALFRHPLGVPIPHTAIIVARKDQFGETLGDFIQSSFLTPDAVVDRVRNAGVGNRIATWLADPDNASRVAGHVLASAVQIADVLRDEDVQDTFEQVVRDRVQGFQVAPAAGKALEFAIEGDRHRPLVDASLRGLDDWLEDHRDELHLRFEQRSPWWLPNAVEDRIFGRLLDGTRAILADMVGPDVHGLRRDLDERFHQLAGELQRSPEMLARGEELKHDLLNQPQLRAWVVASWAEMKEALRTQSEDPGSELHRRLGEGIAAFGQRLQDESALRDKLDDGIERSVRFAVERFAGEITELVSGTIQRWDGEETADRLELLLGPDLQFIRINGTVVGGAAGLILFSIAEAFA